MEKEYRTYIIVSNALEIEEDVLTVGSRDTFSGGHGSAAGGRIDIIEVSMTFNGSQ